MPRRCACASGNAVLLRGGSEAVHSNRAIHAALVDGLDAAGVPAEAVQLMPTQDRAAVGAMLRAAGLIDMIVPRGGKSLVARVQDEARVPVLAHLDGICHTYIHAAADPAMARAHRAQRQDAPHRHLRGDGDAAARRRFPGLGAGRRRAARRRLRAARRCPRAGARSAHRAGQRQRLGHRISRRDPLGRGGRRARRGAGAHRAPFARTTPTRSSPRTPRRPSASSPKSTARS